MSHNYEGVTQRFLRDDERLVLSDEKEMPLVIEANGDTRLVFLQQFIATNSTKLFSDIAEYGAILFRGFDVASDRDFENTMVNIPGFRGITEAFMSEEGRIHVGDLKYILFTNAVYKTGGTLYLGGFHSENYYSTDVPSYISFGCLQPSTIGGETGIINMEKVYEYINPTLKAQLEKNNFFVGYWLVSEVAERYKISTEKIEQLCEKFSIPILGEGRNKCILMYKPNVFLHPLTKKKSLQINFFEILKLNEELRKCFMRDYQGKTWFWHRFVWKLPTIVLKIIEKIYIACASFFYSPKQAIKILLNKIKTQIAIFSLPPHNQIKVGSCFNDEDITHLAKLLRQFYSSCLWQKGDILLVDNRKVVHAGMPGSGPRVIRAIIGNPMHMNYHADQPGCYECAERTTETIGFYMSEQP